MEHFNLLIWLGEKLGASWISPVTIHIVSAGLAALIIIVISLWVKIRTRKSQAWIVPSSKMGLIGILDLFVEWWMGLLEGLIGPKAAKYLPLIGTLFLYIFFCNLLGLIPGFAPPTDNINTNLACALVVFVYYHAVGLKEHGLKNYLRHFMGPVIWLAPLLFVIELISHAVRPVSLSVRLFGNITGDHLVLGIFSHLVPILIPVIFLGLGLFISFIQAFVFSLLSAVYIALAIEH